MLHHFWDEITQNIKKSAQTVRVLAQGTFDLVHAGHVHYLSFARKQGSELIVIVARDDTVKRMKHHAPVQDERTRREMISALKGVDKAVLGGKEDILTKVVDIRPDVIVLGYDQRISIPELHQKLRARGIKCKIIRAKAYRPRIHKSSRLKARAANHSQITST